MGQVKKLRPHAVKEASFTHKNLIFQIVMIALVP